MVCSSTEPFADAKSVRRLKRVKVDVAVRQNDALRLRAGAAGVEEFGDRILVDQHNVAAIGLGCLDPVVVVRWKQPIVCHFAI